MTYQDIYTKFMIEYDKANVTSSYPMLTEYEVATILDRAYLALIWQKVSGNNTRRVPFEYDQKAIADIQPLIRTVEKNLTVPDNRVASNIVATSLPTDCLSFVDLVLKQNRSDHPLDEIDQRNVPTTLIPHSHIENFLVTPYNMPWIKKPVCFLENNNVNIAYDTISLGTLGSNDKALITYIKQPISFVKSLVNYVPTDEDYQNLLTLEDAYELFVRKWQDVYTGDGPSEIIPTDPNDNQGGQTEPTNPENPGGDVIDPTDPGNQGGSGTSGKDNEDPQDPNPGGGEDPGDDPQDPNQGGGDVQNELHDDPSVVIQFLDTYVQEGDVLYLDSIDNVCYYDSITCKKENTSNSPDQIEFVGNDGYFQFVRNGFDGAGYENPYPVTVTILKSTQENHPVEVHIINSSFNMQRTVYLYTTYRTPQQSNDLSQPGVFCDVNGNEYANGDIIYLGNSNISDIAFGLKNGVGQNGGQFEYNTISAEDSEPQTVRLLYRKNNAVYFKISYLTFDSNNQSNITLYAGRYDGVHSIHLSDMLQVNLVIRKGVAQDYEQPQDEELHLDTYFYGIDTDNNQMFCQKPIANRFSFAGPAYPFIKVDKAVQDSTVATQSGPDSLSIYKIDDFGYFVGRMGDWWGGYSTFNGSITIQSNQDSSLKDVYSFKGVADENNTALLDGFCVCKTFRVPASGITGMRAYYTTFPYNFHPDNYTKTTDVQIRYETDDPFITKKNVVDITGQDRYLPFDVSQNNTNDYRVALIIIKQGISSSMGIVVIQEPYSANRVYYTHSRDVKHHYMYSETGDLEAFLQSNSEIVSGDSKEISAKCICIPDSILQYYTVTVTGSENSTPSTETYTWGNQQYTIYKTVNESNLTANFVKK